MRPRRARVPGHFASLACPGQYSTSAGGLHAAEMEFGPRKSQLPGYGQASVRNDRTRVPADHEPGACRTVHPQRARGAPAKVQGRSRACLVTYPSVLYVPYMLCFGTSGSQSMRLDLWCTSCTVWLAIGQSPFADVAPSGEWQRATHLDLPGRAYCFASVHNTGPDPHKICVSESYGEARGDPSRDGAETGWLSTHVRARLDALGVFCAGVMCSSFLNEGVWGSHHMLPPAALERCGCHPMTSQDSAIRAPLGMPPMQQYSTLAPGACHQPATTTGSPPGLLVLMRGSGGTVSTGQCLPVGGWMGSRCRAMKQWSNGSKPAAQPRKQQQQQQQPDPFAFLTATPKPALAAKAVRAALLEDVPDSVGPQAFPWVTAILATAVAALVAATRPIIGQIRAAEATWLWVEVPSTEFVEVVQVKLATAMIQPAGHSPTAHPVRLLGLLPADTATTFILDSLVSNPSLQGPIPTFASPETKRVPPSRPLHELKICPSPDQPLPFSQALGPGHVGDSGLWKYSACTTS
nr:hypothetical protein CFP56_00332 [Quercus suber]